MDPFHLTLRKTPLAVFKLLRPRTDIVAACVAQDIIQSIGLFNISSSFTNDERELCLVVARIVLGDLWNVDSGWVWSTDGSSRLDEEHRDFWNWHIGLSGVISIVESHASNDGYLSHVNWRKKLCIVSGVRSQSHFSFHTRSTERVFAVTRPEKMSPSTSFAETF